MIAKALIALIKAYQLIGRLLHIRTCRFHPSCSQYAVEAINQHGSCKGIVMTLLRIVRCNPLSAGGYDPVR